MRKKSRLTADSKIYFIDACHFLHNAIAGYGWIKRGTTLELLTNSGRNRFNVLGAYSPDDASFLSIEGEQSCDAEMLRELLIKIRTANPSNARQIVILDNARYCHARVVKKLARKLKIELLYLPPYSPNLNLIERFWKFMKKKVAKNKYYPSFDLFVAAVQNFLNNLDEFSEELNSLMTQSFHLFKAAC